MKQKALAERIAGQLSILPGFRFRGSVKTLNGLHGKSKKGDMWILKNKKYDDVFLFNGKKFIMITNGEKK